MFCRITIAASKEERPMTTTKLLYAVAAIIPGGFILLACFGILHVVRLGLRERRQRQAAGFPA
jgi:hypothetical protein